MTALFTRSGIRLTPMRLVGPPITLMNYMLVPGGAGIGSESLAELVDCLPADANAWGVDLPWDGSSAHPDPYGLWPDVVVEAACHFPRTVMVGHSTGGEYILSVPEIGPHASGIVLVSTPPTPRGCRCLSRCAGTTHCPATTRRLRPTQGIRTSRP